ncbi:hypothetical protein N499_0974, partial [Wolbachia pipientis wVitA]
MATCSRTSYLWVIVRF